MVIITGTNIFIDNMPMCKEPRSTLGDYNLLLNDPDVIDESGEEEIGADAFLTSTVFCCF